MTISTTHHPASNIKTDSFTVTSKTFSEKLSFLSKLRTAGKSILTFSRKISLKAEHKQFKSLITTGEVRLIKYIPETHSTLFSTNVLQPDRTTPDQTTSLRQASSKIDILQDRSSDKHSKEECAASDCVEDKHNAGRTEAIENWFARVKPNAKFLGPGNTEEFNATKFLTKSYGALSNAYALCLTEKDNNKGITRTVIDALLPGLSVESFKKMVFTMKMDVDELYVESSSNLFVYSENDDTEAFVSSDPKSPLFLNETQLKHGKPESVVCTILHELSHVIYKTNDYFYLNTKFDFSGNEQRRELDVKLKNLWIETNHFISDPRNYYTKFNELFPNKSEQEINEIIHLDKESLKKKLHMNADSIAAAIVLLSNYARLQNISTQ